MDNSIDISGINKGILLHSLWKGQVTESFFGSNSVSPPDFNEDQATKVAKAGYIDYYCGRAIKTDLSKDAVDPWLYDRDAGKGEFQRIVKEIRERMNLKDLFYSFFVSGQKIE